MTDTTQVDDLDAKIDQVGDLAAATQVTNVTIVLDRSGSMNRIRSDVIGGLNAFVEEQQKVPGACALTLWTFDDVAKEMVLKDTPIADVPMFSEKDFVPRGSTPLYDAIGAALAEADVRHQSGDHEIFVIITDGKENASKEHSKQSVFESITKRTSDGWVFTYIGANHDAYEASSGIGIARGSTQSFAATADGASKSFASIGRATKSYRMASAGGQSVSHMVTDFYEGVKEAEDDLLGKTEITGVSIDSKDDSVSS